MHDPLLFKNWFHVVKADSMQCLLLVGATCKLCVCLCVCNARRCHLLLRTEARSLPLRP